MASSDVAVSLLGPVEVRHGAVRLELTRLELSLVSALATTPRRPVSADRLIEFIWWPDPPASAPNRVQALVSGIRRQLGPGSGVLRTVAPGYLLDLSPEQVDAADFERLVAAARRDIAAGKPTGAADKLRRSLSLWRGAALDSVQGRTAELHAARLEELRLQALEDYAELLVGSRRTAEILACLTSELTLHPERERLRLLAMRALEASGRRAEALLSFDDAVRFSREELGVDPGPELFRLHRRLLTATPPVDRDEITAGHPGIDAPKASEAQLPADTSRFTGRESEQAALLTALDAKPAGAAMVVTVSGMAGVGKTALAVRLAHQLAPRYPDGELFVDLHGFTDGIEPADPAIALGRLLRALGVAAKDMPQTLEDRAGAYRSRLASRRMLIVFDDAASEGQIRPLLPGAPGCLVLITSRLTMAGLDDTLPIALDALDTADAVRLLARLVDDPGMITSQAKAAAEVAELCGGLPLAIRLVASRLRHRRPWTLRYLAERLQDSGDRLQELQAGERSVATALATSYHGLTGLQQSLFRVLGLNPCTGIDGPAAAAMAGLDTDQAEYLLERLVDANLLEQPAPGRYKLHDLVRLYAAATAAEILPADRDLALELLFRHYLWGACAAMDALAPYSKNRRRCAAMADSTFAPFTSYAAAFSWLESRLDDLLTVIVAAAERGFPDLARTLSESLFHVLERGAHFTDGLRINEFMARVLRQSGDRIGAATALRCAGVLARHLGRSSDALEFLRQAYAILDRAEPSLHLASVLINLGELLTDAGSLAEAATHFERALAIIREAGDHLGEEYCLRIFSPLQWMRGQRTQAIESVLLAAELSHAAGHHGAEAYAHLALGSYFRQLGRHARALDHLQRAGELWTLVVDPTGTSLRLSELGATHSAMRQYDQAQIDFLAALRIAREAGDRGAEFEALVGTGDAALGAGDLDGSIHHYRAAAQIADSLRQPRSIIRARDGLARASLSMGRPDRAIEQWEGTLAEFGALDITEIETIRQRLAEVSPAAVAKLSPSAP